MPQGNPPDLVSLDQQIKRLKALRKKWESAEGLTDEELVKRELTLELLDGAIDDLLTKRTQFEKKDHNK